MDPQENEKYPQARPMTAEEAVSPNRPVVASEGQCEGPPTPVIDFNAECRECRANIKMIGAGVKALMRHNTFSIPGCDGDKRDFGEMKANIMLAYRHLEAAAMRVGKAIQAYDGGVSVYDK